jgi:predicted N-acyltransferase
MAGGFGKIQSMVYDDLQVEIRVAQHIADIGADEWNGLSGKLPFQSHRWYEFGERVMTDCKPIYILAYQDKRLIGRAALWGIRNEPLPKYVSRWRGILEAFLRRHPLLVCRSPFSSFHGIILPDPPVQDEVLEMLGQAAIKEIRRLGGSFLIFDYLENKQMEWIGWPPGFAPISLSFPNTVLTLQWETFEEYLAKNKWRMRQHYKRSSRSATELGIRITRHDSVDDLDAPLALIRNMERRHESAPNPWARGMLDNMSMVEHTWLEAHIGGQLVGCMLLLEDNGVQIAVLPGLSEDVQFAYFMLLYEAIKEGLEKKLTALYWGSGAYETKRRLGFELKMNDNLMFMFANPFVNFIMRRLV